MLIPFHSYTEETIESLDWRQHIRRRPGIYIGKIGDGSEPEDGIYMLVKEIIDNSIDEHTMGFGKTIEIQSDEKQVKIRDYGRGIPLGKVLDCASKINTGGKYDSRVFHKSIGLHGIGLKAANALSDQFIVNSFRNGQVKSLEFSRGILVKNHPLKTTEEKDGAYVIFRPDGIIFKDYRFSLSLLEEQIEIYAFLNRGLTLFFNKKRYISKRGLTDFLHKKIISETLWYPLVHLKGKDIEIAFTHTNRKNEEYYSFVNGQHTIHGGTHLTAFREGIAKTIREYWNKNFGIMDIRNSMVFALSIRLQEPIFESQTKTKLGSVNITPQGPTVRSFIINFLKKTLDDFLCKNPDVAQQILKRILHSERERKEIIETKKLISRHVKKAKLHNKCLRDCRIHLNDKTKNLQKKESTLFITEGDSASGSITKSRNVETQAVFSLRGKPLNTFSTSKKIVDENEEFNLLQHALNIGNSLEGLRYNKVVLATDADVDGMHIRLLMLTFFLQFFIDLIKRKHVYILETPLFRIRNKRKTIYAYSKKEKEQALKKLNTSAEITRFKGLGEISPDEFEHFIGKNIRLKLVLLQEDTISIQNLLSYYMGKNTSKRQQFIIQNLKVEKNTTPI